MADMWSPDEEADAPADGYQSASATRPQIPLAAGIAQGLSGAGRLARKIGRVGEETGGAMGRFVGAAGPFVADALIDPAARTAERFAYGEGKQLFADTSKGRQARSDLVDAIPIGMAAAKPMVKTAVTLADKLGAGKVEHGVARMFVGPPKAGSSDTASLRAYKDAMNYEAQGMEPKEIWIKTGYFRGSDSHWREELSDAGTAFRGMEELYAARKKDFDKVDVIKEAADYQSMLASGMPLAEVKKVFKGTYGKFPTMAHEQYAKNFTRDELADAVEAHLLTLYDTPHYNKAEKMLPHPVLYDRYPHLAQEGANLVPQRMLGAPNVMGHYRAGTGALANPPNWTARTKPGELEIRARYAEKPGTARDIMLHEQQHAVQTHEGFDPGANASAIQRIRNISPMEAHSAYKRNMGEAEARLTQERRDWNMAQRRHPNNFPPEHSARMGYNYEDLISERDLYNPSVAIKPMTYGLGKPPRP